jgi:hypothetical protein
MPAAPAKGMPVIIGEPPVEAAVAWLAKELATDAAEEATLERSEATLERAEEAAPVTDALYLLA